MSEFDAIYESVKNEEVLVNEELDQRLAGQLGALKQAIGYFRNAMGSAAPEEKESIQGMLKQPASLLMQIAGSMT